MNIFLFSVTGICKNQKAHQFQSMGIASAYHFIAVSIEIELRIETLSKVAPAIPADINGIGYGDFDLVGAGDTGAGVGETVCS